MSIRVTQHNMYNSMVGSMQKNLGAYMESVQQGSTQKKINRPSDDPAGAYRVLTTRMDMTATTQYQENVDTAKGWLNLADSILSSRVTTAVTGLKALAEQASTGTYDASQREIMADQARQYFGQLLNLANTQFEDKSIFAGHAYDKNAFEEGLAITSWDENWEAVANAGVIDIQGATSHTIMIQFQTENPGDEIDLAKGVKYKWYNNATSNWEECTVDVEGERGNEKFVIKPEGAGIVMTIDNPANKNQDPIKVKGADPDEKAGANNGTMLYIRPTAIYQGDDNDPPVESNVMAAGKKLVIGDVPNIDITAGGNFGQDVSVRIDGQKDDTGVMQAVDLSKPNIEFDWSYSTDGGTTWINAKGATTDSGTVRLQIPGSGYIELSGTDAQNELAAGTEVKVEVSRTNSAEVKSVGDFGKNIMVRIDGQRDDTGVMQAVDFSKSGNEFDWSYSTDGGTTWINAKGKTTDSGTARLPLPGGYIELDASKNGNELNAGMQVLVHPARANLDYEIMKDTYLSVNSVGKDVFGGYYEGKPALSGDDNLFEVVGAFIGYLETNNQEGCQKTLAALRTAEEKVLAEATRIGGMENRLEMAEDVLSYQKLDQQERLSYVEDIDLTELLTRLTRQQLTYQTVLQSSSMIMKLSLANYV